MVRTVILALGFICQFYAVPAQNIQSRHFTIETLADGVYAAIATTGGYAICNAGIVDLGNTTLIFDPFMTPEAAEDLKAAAFTLTGSPVKYVINSHFHNDHIGGNQVFTDATIISSTRARELILEMFPIEYDYYKEVAPNRLERFRSADQSQMTAHQREENRMWVGYFEALVSSLEGLRLVAPDVTFEEKLTIHGNTRSVQLHCYGEGHTGSDVFMYVPDAQVAFLGDLLFIQNQPWLGDGNVDSWKHSLDRIAQLPLQKVVPGHGPAGSIADFAPMKEYMDHVGQRADGYHRNQTQPGDDPNMTSPPPYDNWFLSMFYRMNVIFMYEQQQKTK